MEGRSVTREQATLIILAGGEGRRMGFPKHQLTIGKRTVLEVIYEQLSGLFAETIVVGHEVAALRGGVRVIEDRYAVQSPLVGIHAGLSASQTELTFVVACDMPYVASTLVSHLLALCSPGVDVVVPLIGSYYEPLSAVYRTTCLNSIEALIERGSLKITPLYEEVHIREVGERELRLIDPKLRSFVNLNTPSQHRLAAAGE